MSADYSTQGQHRLTVAPVSYYEVLNLGALVSRIGFWGPFYYNYNKDPQNSIDTYSSPCSSLAFRVQKGQQPTALQPTQQKQQPWHNINFESQPQEAFATSRRSLRKWVSASSRLQLLRGSGNLGWKPQTVYSKPYKTVNPTPFCYWTQV